MNERETDKGEVGSSSPPRPTSLDCFIDKIIMIRFSRINIWGHSSAGRAPALQAGGRRFDPAWLHQRVI